ncbi:trans-1,2-dihydrobenzene-1,2-diol dehydrogenase-like [Acanthaster planci]|uniref:Trans-1,2-dihydrobenzene-1,2-diol dehydrogenase n=1 Tax=Acanthaster planci TaxID=133434 RepID=A0A8B7ZX05_ACAPL|nr:trans-1,2-dihydrobenzene-1,2-diol dehydrogenase-like [Acanthaster planci]XP_022109626.1 trans-1,2-dihydrobenzene-1,2-diol dehydrogenase-like [Acanthaster planci]XP_022109627.1 trans-1,2-dihydrobenzene-1,2-diol dehydrogenase-like [Acanthaster planci]
MKLRWGICSAGNISNDFVVALSTLPAEDHAVVAVAARSKEDASKFAERHGIPVAYGGYEALAEDDNVDIVYIGAVNNVHLPLCKLFLGKDKNVLCEKPLGLNKREVQEMVNLARQKNVFFMEGWWTRFFPATAKLCELLDAGVIGDIKAVNVSLGKPISSVERLRNKDVGGGAVLDLGVYPIREALMIFGEAPISCTSAGTLTDSGVDETTVTTLIFPGKAVATLNTSMVVELANEAQIRGAKGYIKVHSPFWCPSKIEVTAVMGGAEHEVVKLTEVDLKTEVYEFCHPKAEKRTFFVNSAGLRYEAECARQCLMKGLKECPTVSLDESLLAAEILDKARWDVGYRLPADDL